MREKSKDRRKYLHISLHRQRRSGRGEPTNFSEGGFYSYERDSDIQNIQMVRKLKLLNLILL